MKVLVNGVETELSESAPDVQISQMHDRLLVRTAEGTQSAVVLKHGGKTHVSYRGRTYVIEPVSRSRSVQASTDGNLKAVMPGTVIEVYVEEGETVEKGQKLAVLEAMKTQMPIIAPFSGVVTEVSAVKGRQVQEGDTLVRISE